MADHPRDRGSTGRNPGRSASGGPASRRDGGGGVPDGALVGGLGLLLLLALFTWTATGLAGLLSHGSWPEGVTFSRTPTAMGALVGDPQDLAAAWPQASARQLSGHGLFWGLFIGQLLTALVLTVFLISTVTRARAVRRSRRADNDTSERPAEVTPKDASSAPATPEPVGRPGKPSAPSPTVTAPTTAIPEGEHAPTEGPATPLFVPSASTPSEAAVESPETRIHEATGAVLAATGDAALWERTKDARAKLGPIHVFDPTHLCDTPSRLRWSPHHGCADRATAAARATALLAPLRSPRPVDAEVHTAAETLLRCWLHAAALDGKPFRELHRWAHAKTESAAPVRILRTDPKASAGSAGELEAILAGHPERRRAAEDLVHRVLEPLSQLHVRDACNASRADRVALESFVHETGTLYVVGQDPGITPILSALTQCVVEHGRRMAARSSPGRLDPPLTTVLELPLPRSEGRPNLELRQEQS